MLLNFSILPVSEPMRNASTKSFQDVEMNFPLRDKLLFHNSKNIQNQRFISMLKPKLEQKVVTGVVTDPNAL